MSRRVAVVADSACDLPAAVAADAGVTLVPLTVSFGEESYLDGVELTTEAFWDRVERGGPHPTTASPSPGALADAWAATDASEGVVSIHLSAALSRTVETARAASAGASPAVEVVDSRSVSMAHGLVVLEAARVAASGASLPAVADAARATVARLVVGAVLERVDFLRRGGRVGAAKALASDLLRIRPVLGMEDGAPVLVARARTRRRALDEVLDRLPRSAAAAAVFHAGAPDVDEARRRVAETTGVEPTTGLIGPVTGTHLGPGALGVAVVARP